MPDAPRLFVAVCISIIHRAFESAESFRKIRKTLAGSRLPRGCKIRHEKRGGAARDEGVAACDEMSRT
jgi:hypothetical protein